MHVLARAAIAVIATLAFAACSTGGTATTGPGGGSAAASTCHVSTAAGTVKATAADFQFSPDPIQAKVGDVVTWTNSGPSGHNPTLDNDPTCTTGVIASGATGSLTFTAAGSFAYHCQIHPSMKGTIVVSG
jgi:plastocyanin